MFNDDRSWSRPRMEHVQREVEKVDPTVEAAREREEEARHLEHFIEEERERVAIENAEALEQDHAVGAFDSRPPGKRQQPDGPITTRPRALEDTLQMLLATSGHQAAHRSGLRETIKDIFFVLRAGFLVAVAALLLYGLVVWFVQRQNAIQQPENNSVTEEPPNPIDIPARATEHPASGHTHPSLPLGSHLALPRTNIRVVILPLLTSAGIIYGVEARDETSRVLLANAKQVATDGDVLVVEETEYFLDGTVSYRGKLFFLDSELLKEQRTSGHKRWSIFRAWIGNR